MVSPSLAPRKLYFIAIATATDDGGGRSGGDSGRPHTREDGSAFDTQGVSMNTARRPAIGTGSAASFTRQARKWMVGLSAVEAGKNERAGGWCSTINRVDGLCLRHHCTGYPDGCRRL